MENDPRKEPEHQAIPEERPPVEEPRQAQVMVKGMSHKPIATYVILGLTILVFLVQNISKLQFGVDFPLNLFAKVNPRIVIGEYWRLVSPILVHASIMHIGFNMYALWILGRQIETLFGSERFIMLYILGAFGGNVLSFALSQNPSVGASTAIFALISAQAVFIIRNRKFFGPGSRQMLSQIGFILVLNFVIAVVPGSSLDLWGHLGGFLAGVAFSILASPLLKLDTKDGRAVLADASYRKDRYIAFLMVLVAFSAIVFIVIQRLSGSL